MQAVGGTTRVIGVFGDPVQHSLSPAMHNAALAHLGLDYVYVPFHVPQGRLAAACEGLRALQVRGTNVTIPHKVEIQAHLDARSQEAELIGAVNTVVNEDGRLVGYNTDGAGFVRSLREEAAFAPDGRRVLLLGAGGAAKAIAVGLALAGAGEIVIANRTLAKAEAIANVVQSAASTRARALGVAQWPAPDDAALRAAAAEAELIVNATSLGMHAGAGEPPIIPAAWLQPDHCVCDIVYTPPETPLLAAAKAAGARALPGIGMLIHQGAIAFEHFTGQPAPVAVMRAALLAALGRH